MDAQTRTFGLYILYRHFDAEGTLLYVGASCDPFKRAREHMNESNWFHEVATITLERFLTAELLNEAEKLAIQREGPIFNIAYRKHTQNPAPVKGAAFHGFELACRKWVRHLNGDEKLKAAGIVMRMAGVEIPWEDHNGCTNDRDW